MVNPKILADVLNDRPFWFNSHCMKAVELPHDARDVCWECNMDSVCNEEIQDLCEGIAEFWGGHWMLRLIA